MIGRIENYFRRTRRRLSRSEWAVRLLKLSRAEKAPTAPGLVLIQIDGLSMSQFEEALQRGKMPFLERLMRREHFSVRSLFSGVPSSTSAVQAELLYGLKNAVPGFSFYDRQARQRIDLLNAQSVRRIEQDLEARGHPLLKDGCAYAGIFSGGARDIRFAMSAEGLRVFPTRPNPRVALFFLLSNLYSLARTLGLGGAEIALALKDSVSGLLRDRQFRHELRYVPVRVAVCILLRELAVIAAKIDLARSVPTLHVSFLGYDEQSHRRGPSSAFAHWTLRGIDDAIARIWRAARRAGGRHYDIWIYSGHGHEDSKPFEDLHGRSMHKAVASVLGQEAASARSPYEKSGISHLRARWLGRRFDFLRHGIKESREMPLITAIGSLGHVYLAHPPGFDERAALGERLVREAGIPMAATAAEGSEALVWTAEGQFVLPRDGKKLFEPIHPFAQEAAEDLAALCHHPHSGDFLLCGWAPEETPLTFPGESGAHGGPGPEETSGFVLLPNDAPVDWRETICFRPLDLHRAALSLLETPKGAAPSTSPSIHSPAKRGVFRVMTYNVHSCVGMDGKVFPERVARVIAQYEPDVVALQEIDVERLRTGGVHQAEVIARHLEMDFHFQPAMMFEREKYGDAILSLHPMRLLKATDLPHLDEPWLEPRGAIMAEIEVLGTVFHVINTHLSLSRKERLLQAQALAGPQWLGLANHAHPVILCGDFNAMPSSPVCRLLSQHLDDAQACLAGHRARNTWFGRLPLSRIDHVFVDKRLAVEKVLVPSTHLTRETSDHLPLIVDVRIKQ